MKKKLEKKKTQQKRIELRIALKIWKVNFASAMLQRDKFYLFIVLKKKLSNQY